MFSSSQFILLPLMNGRLSLPARFGTERGETAPFLVILRRLVNVMLVCAILLTVRGLDPQVGFGTLKHGPSAWPGIIGSLYFFISSTS